MEEIKITRDPKLGEIKTIHYTGLDQTDSPSPKKRKTFKERLAEESKQEPPEDEQPA